MAETSKIEWTDATWSPITGCTLVSEGCRHCYAATLAATRLKNHPSRQGLARINAAGEAKFTGQVRFNEQWLDQPLRWRRQRMIFVCAHSDLFHESVPDEWIDRVFAVMALATQHTFQILTKRPERMREYLSKHDCSKPGDRITDLAFSMNCRVRGYRGSGGGADWPFPNVWLGTSVEDQATADTRIPHLLATPAAVRFVSAEPLLGPVVLDDMCDGWKFYDALRGNWWHDCEPPAIERGKPKLDWVITGGESGPGARPMHPEWPRALRDQCQAAGVAFFFKQWGEWLDERAATAMHLAPGTDMFDRYGQPVGPKWHPYEASDRNGGAMIRVGKKRAGRQLDGRTWDEMPGRAL